MRPVLRGVLRAGLRFGAAFLLGEGLRGGIVVDRRMPLSHVHPVGPHPQNARRDVHPLLGSDRVGRERALDVDVEAALHEAQDAVGLVGCDVEQPGDLGASTREHAGAHGGEPARGGGPVDAVERTDLVDGQAVDDVITQQAAVTRAKRVERDAEASPQVPR